MRSFECHRACRPSCFRRMACMLLALLNALVSGSCMELYAARGQAFSVSDSIEMTTFSDPSARTARAVSKMSPNGKCFFVITTKGKLANNQLQSTIWLYTTAELVEFLHSKNVFAPKPRLLWQNTAVPKAQQFDSYGSLITRAQWSSDSSSILFLAEIGDRIRRLYRVNVQNHRGELLSSQATDITDFAEAAGTIAYVSGAAASVSSEQQQATTISRVLTGTTLFNILDSKNFPTPGSLFKPINLWVRKANHNARINPPLGPEQWRYPIAAGSFFHLSLSPDGNALIAAKPARQITSSWRNYISVLPNFDFEKLPIAEPHAGEDWNWPWQYTYIDLRHNRLIPLVDAPSGWTAGYGDSISASWSRDGSRVLATNTFMPIDPESAGKSQMIPCAAVVFSTTSKKSQCVAYLRYPKTNSHLRSAAFGASSQEVALVWTNGEQQTIETYRENSDKWILMKVTDVSPDEQGSLAVSVRQDLNESPTLWVTDLQTNRSKPLWNPNLRLTSLQMARAVVYRWKDNSGYEWKGGLLKPLGYRPGIHYPLVVQTHGFNEHEFLVDGAYTTGSAAQPLATAGIMVLQIEDRSDRHLKPVREEASLFADGCAAAIRQLTEDGLIDPSRVGIVGFSRSSWYVETTLEKYPSLFKAATIIDGVDQGYMSYMLFCPELASCKSDHEAANGGPPFVYTLSNWLTTAPDFSLDKVRAPVRIEAIGKLSILQEWEIYASLRLHGQPVDFIYIPEGQHILQQPQQRYASQQGDVDWFRFWLQAFERPGPAAKGQYQRWQLLKQLSIDPKTE
jgi:hypothetical protein